MPASATGGAGTTQYGGHDVSQFDTTKMPGGNSYSGAASTDPNGAIAFDVSLWGSIMTPPVDPASIVEFVGTYHHETAHLEYVNSYSTWAAAHPTDAAAFEDCIKNLKNPDGTSKGYHVPDENPCSEAFASSSEATAMCQDKQAICTKPDLSQAEKQALIKAIDQDIKDVVDTCNKNIGDCQTCGGTTAPPGCPNCPSASCPCP